MACVAVLMVASPAWAALKLVGQWGSPGAAPGQFGLASALTVSQGKVLVGDQATSSQKNPNRVQLFDLAGRFLSDFSLPFNPQQIATDATGNVYVAAGAGNPFAVQAYSPAGVLLASWTGVGTPAGRLTPDGVAAANGRVYVADHTRVVVFTSTGQYITQFGAAGGAPGQFGDVRRVALDTQGDIYVLDANPARVEKFDSSGKFLAQFGLVSANGTINPASVYGAGGLAVSPSGFLYVAGFYSFRIQKFTLDGELVSVFQCGTADVGGVDCRPNDIAFDLSGSLYVIDSTTRILKFSEATTPPPPVLGKAVDIKPVSGHVFVRLAHSNKFVSLTQASQVPVGSAVDARKGTLALTSATTRKTATYSGSFGGAIFSIAQSKKHAQRGLTTLALVEHGVRGGPSFSRCSVGGHKQGRIAKLSHRVLALLHASAHGRFRSRGRYAAATVRGTKWDTVDRCDGTLTIVHRGTVIVSDLRRHRDITVTAGHRYLAKAP